MRKSPWHGAPRPVKVPLKDFSNDLEAMAAAVNERTRLVFLTNPHNPTGTYLPAAEIAAFAAALPDELRAGARRSL